jgi:hypothetical protein
MVKPKTKVVYRFVPNDVAKEKRWMATAIWAEGSDSKVVVVVVAVVFVSRPVAPTATKSAKDRTALELCNAGVIHGCGVSVEDDEAEDNAVVPGRPPPESALTMAVDSLYRCPPRRPTVAPISPCRWNDQAAATVGFVDHSNTATDHHTDAAVIMMMTDGESRIGWLSSRLSLWGPSGRRECEPR